MKQSEKKLLEEAGYTIVSDDPLHITKGDEFIKGASVLEKIEELKGDNRTSVMTFGSGGRYPAKKR